MADDNTGKAQIRSFAERIIRLQDEADALASDIKEVRSEAKATGFNLKALNGAIKIARMTAQERDELNQFQLEMDLYVDAVLGTSDE